jgi:uncharacterized protein YcgL (UPF0745 family)
MLKEYSMEKLKIVIYGLVILFTLTGILHAADLGESFLDLKWGTSISELPEFKKISENGDVAYYRNPAKTYTVFEVEDPSVIYGFYKGKFFATYIQVGTYTVFERVKEHISKKFGEPKTTLKMKTRQTIHQWKHQKIKIKLKLYELDGRMKLAFYYTPLSNQVNEAQQEDFPAVSEREFTLDEGSKQEIQKDLKLERALNVMEF